MKNSTWCLISVVYFAVSNIGNEEHGQNLIPACIFAAALLICKAIEDK